MKIIIAGSRTFSDYELLAREIESFAGPKLAESTIVSGHANGADKLGERFAEEHNLPLIIVPADWSTYGRAAGPERNRVMVKISTSLVAFWDGKSRGTKSMINEARKHGLNVKVVKF